MAETTSPGVLRILIADELKALRTAAGLSRPEAATLAGCTPGAIGHLETQARLPSLEVLQQLLRAYGAIDRLESFGENINLARQPQWWSSLSETRQPAGFMQYVAIEQGATNIDTYEQLFIPGLLQTPDFAHALVSTTGDLDEDGLQRRLELRTRRADALTRTDAPLHLWAIIDEAALLRRAGTNAVMAEQMQHLLTLGELPNVQLQIIPTSAGVYAAPAHAFTILNIPVRGHPGVVYAELRTRSVWIEEQVEIEQFRITMNHLRVQASSPEATREIIEQHRKEWKT